MTSFMNSSHDRCGQEVSIGTHGKAHIEGTTETGSERMRRASHFTTREVVAHSLQETFTKGNLLRFSEVTFQARSIDGVATGLNTLQQIFTGFTHRNKQGIVAGFAIA